VVEQDAGIVAMASRTDRANNRGQGVAVERNAKRARRQWEHLAHIIDALTPDGRGELLDCGPGQLGKRTGFAWFESEGATNGERVSEKRRAKQSVGEQARQDCLNVG